MTGLPPANSLRDDLRRLHTILGPHCPALIPPREALALADLQCRLVLARLEAGTYGREAARFALTERGRLVEAGPA